MRTYDKLFGKPQYCTGWKDKPVCPNTVTKGEKCLDCRDEHDRMRQREYYARRQAKAAAKETDL
ncbi:MAG: hypothetical protein ABIO88_04960 [Burkholderiaceae bacterium]